MKAKRGGYLTLKIRLLNGRLFNKYLQADGRALYNGEQGKILSALWDKHPQTATDLAIVTGLANSTLSIMLRRLEERGLITGKSAADDKRKRLFDLTPSGRAQEAVGNAVSRRLNDVFYEGFSDDEIAELDRYLERVLRNLESAMDSVETDTSYDAKTKYEAM